LKELVSENLMTSEKSKAANQANAKQSRGPKSLAGKARSSQNARAHGVLSAGLLLKDEDPAEYDQLFQALVEDMRPHGTLELIHIERIAAAVWRQRRLIRAESAAVAFRQAADDTRKMLTDTLGVSDSSRIPDVALGPLSDDEIRELGVIGALLDELALLKPAPVSLQDLKVLAPIFHSYLYQQASLKQMGLERYIVLETDLLEVQIQEAIDKLVVHLLPLFAKKYAVFEQRLKISLMRESYQAMKIIPPEAELYARYQTSLDNMLNKAIKAFRDARDYRLDTLEQAEKN
jgi:hypothetical protein